MGGRERWDYLRRVEEIVGRLGIEGEEIIQLAHKTNFHQKQAYGEILYRLARLSDKYGKESELVRVSEEILAISPGNPLSIG